MIYDCAIIGTGPADLSAALNLKIHGKRFLWLGSKAFSEKVRRAEEILNYPGLAAVSGETMCAAFHRQAEQMGLEIQDAMVTSIMNFGSHYAILAQENFYEAKTVILATGVTAVATIPGEPELLGRGVSYCATCDGGLYRGKTIAVVCTSARFEHEVTFLAGLAAKVFYFPGYQEVGTLPENVQILPSRVVKIQGDDRVQSVLLKDGSELPVDGVFCLRDSISLSSLLPDVRKEQGHIAVDRSMATNLPGCFAAGDCTGRPYQYVKAAGEGNVAAHSVIAFLAQQEKA